MFLQLVNVRLDDTKGNNVVCYIFQHIIDCILERLNLGSAITECVCDSLCNVLRPLGEVEFVEFSCHGLKVFGNLRVEFRDLVFVVLHYVLVGLFLGILVVELFLKFHTLLHEVGILTHKSLSKVGSVKV